LGDGLTRSTRPIPAQQPAPTCRLRGFSKLCARFLKPPSDYWLRLSRMVILRSAF